MSAPPDGYYWATVFHDTGGSVRTPVQVVGGEILTWRGWMLLPEACSEFVPMPLEKRMAWWPAESVKEWRDLEAEVARLRNENVRLKEEAVALAEKLKDRERERDHANDTATAVLEENKALEEKVKRFNEALADPAAVWSNMLRGTIAMPPHIPDMEGKLHDAAVRIEQLEEEVADYRTLYANWKAYATNIESVGDAFEDAAYSIQDWSGTHMGDTLDEWAKAKETRP